MFELVRSRFYKDRAAYYKEYCKLISSAQETIISVGDGFTCNNPDDDEFAIDLLDALRGAAKRCKVQRLQYIQTASIRWLRMLNDLQRGCENVDVYILDDDPVGLPSVLCIVDPGSRDASLNVMFTQSGRFATQNARIAGPAFIFSDESKLDHLTSEFAGFIREFFSHEQILDFERFNQKIEETREERWQRIDAAFQMNQSSDEPCETDMVEQVANKSKVRDLNLVGEYMIKKTLVSEELYFAYGSNMDTGRMIERCSSAVTLGRARLPGFRLAFNLSGRSEEHKDQGKKCAIANVISSKDDDVYGVLYGVSHDDLLGLSDLEQSFGYDDVVSDCCVEFDHNRVMIPARVFVGRADGEEYAPAEQYREFIVNGMRKHQLPEKYQAELLAHLGLLSEAAECSVPTDDELTIPKFDVFLSHNRKDKAGVRKLRKKLVDDYQLSCWLDEDQLPPGVPWLPLLEKGIRDSKSVAILVGNDGEGPWQAEETRAALELAVREQLRVIPVLLPNASAKPDLPMFLLNRTWVDLRGGLKKKDVDRLIWAINDEKPSR